VMSPPASVVVATHGHCFDGMASAVLFTRLLRALRPELPEGAFVYRSCDSRPGESGVPERWLKGTENAILDFRYSTSPALTWYFDHHATAFASDEERAHFLERQGTQRFHDGGYPSCTKLIADVARARFSLHFPELDELVRWADLIDAARFPDAETAVAKREPELKLMTVVEHHGDDTFLAAIVPRLSTQPLAEVAAGDDVLSRYAPLEKRRDVLIERMRARSELRGPVVFCDLGDEPTDVVEKFALYALHPGAVYAVVITRTSSRVKVSIGYNPWTTAPRTHDIGLLCRRHGGGGHPVVGAFALPGDQVERARTLVAAILQELAG
jgi:hypothetical protein